MRTTLELDDALVARAKFLTGHDDIAKIVQEALAVLIERESGRRLARLGELSLNWDCRGGVEQDRSQLANSAA